MENNKKSIDITRAESNELDALINLMQRHEAESFEKKAISEIMHGHITNIIKTLAKKHGLDGDDFDYRDGKIIVSETGTPEITPQEAVPEEETE